MTRLHRAAEAHQDRLLARADRSADAAERAVRRVWLRLLRAIRAGGPHFVVYRAALAALRSLPAVASQVLDDLADTARDAAAWTTTDILRMRPLLESRAPKPREAGTLHGRPLQFVRHPRAGRGETLILVDPRKLDADWKLDPTYHLPTVGIGATEVPGRREAASAFIAQGNPVEAARVRLGSNGIPYFLDGRHRTAALRDAGAELIGITVPTAQAAQFIDRYGPASESPMDALASELLLPSLTDAQIHAVVYRAGWVERIQSLTKLAEPETLAARIANAVQAGQSVQAIARDIRPLVQGVQTSARRVARTAGLWIAHEAELHTYEQLPDVIEGYQVNAVLDHATRPEHRRRDGWKYYRAPSPRQRGFDAMPRPPREADGSWAFNCRCWLEPLLRPL